MSEFFTSDTHYYHENVIGYDQRPFKTMGEMLDKMIENWNRVVKPNDIVYHLGDVAMISGGQDTYIEYLAELNSYMHGHKILIKGNHDRSAKIMYQCGFDEIHSTLYLPYGNKNIFLVHNPWTKTVQIAGKIVRAARIAGPASKAVGRSQTFPLVKPAGADIVLHGHIHNRGWLSLVDSPRLYVNVGTMLWGYTPRRLEELLAAALASTSMPVSVSRLSIA